MTLDNPLSQKIKTLSTGQILAGIYEIGGGSDVDQEQRIVRAYLIEEYESRMGAEMADALMDKIGM